MIRNAKDLSPDEKTVLESLLGRRIQVDEAIRRCGPDEIIPDHQRQNR